jgi:small-conductance mechanosensitive channel
MSFLREREHLRRLPLPLSALALFGGGVGVSLSLKPCATEILRLPRDSALRKDLLTTVVRWNADLRDQIELLEESKLRQEAMRAQQQEPQPELQSQQPPPPLPPASGRPSP